MDNLQCWNTEHVCTHCGILKHLKVALVMKLVVIGLGKELSTKIHYIVHSTNGNTCSLLGCLTLTIVLELEVIAYDFVVCKNLTKPLIIGLDIKQKHRIGYDWLPDSKLYLHKNREIIISHVEGDTKSNLLLLPEPVTLEAHTCTAILTKLVNPSLPMENKLYESHHDDLQNISNLSLK